MRSDLMEITNGNVSVVEWNLVVTVSLVLLLSA
jgi:hypothetical protein